jgi:catechol 2,3-dioxygenase-like lactoylglutathione lyase family enzyme
MQPLKVIPVLRIFDYEKTIEFYIEWLGFHLEWQHEPEKDQPVYMEIALNEITLHLTEHHGDCSAGGKVFIECTGLEQLHKRLTDKNYKYNKPTLVKSDWGNAVTMELHDPFGNRLLFCQNINHE